MKLKYLLAIPMLLLLMMSVLASDFSVRGKMENPSYNGMKLTAKFSGWHDDGKAPTCNRWWCSKGQPPQGQSTLELMAINQDIRMTLNLILDESSVTFNNNKFTIINNVRGTFWVKGEKPIQFTDVLTYVYDVNLGKVTIYWDGETLIIPVKQVSDSYKRL